MIRNFDNLAPLLEDWPTKDWPKPMGKGDPAVPILDDLLNELKLVPPDWDGDDVGISAPADTAGEAALTLCFFNKDGKKFIVRLELHVDGTWKHRLVVAAEKK